MDTGLKGRRVLITGGTGGIGNACAQAFLKEGSLVALLGRNERRLEEASHAFREQGFDVVTLALDLSDVAQAATLAARVATDFGDLDVLVNCAGAARRTPLQQLSADAWRAAMDAKFFPYIHALDALLPGMIERGSGAVVNVIGAGGKVAMATHLPGGAANAALMLATMGLAHAYAANGVRINAVNPGPVATPRHKAGIAAEATRLGTSEDEASARLIRGLSIGRVAAPEEIAAVVLFLCSCKASYVTGAQVTMDGASFPVVV